MIIIFLLILLIIIIILLVNNKEKFKNLLSYKKNYKYLNIKQASEVLKSVDELNNYNKLDYKLRNINKDNYENTCDFYIEKLENFGKHEKVVIDWVMKVLDEKTPENLKFLYEDISFAKYSNGVENNFPHTHKNTIFLSKKYLSSCFFYFNTNMEEDMLENFGVVIIHECVHLWQRKNTELFNKLYVYYWNFVKVDKIHNNYLEKYIRFNPDGNTNNWVLNNKSNNKHIMLVSLYTDNSKNIGNVENVAIYLDRHEITYILPSKDNLKKIPINKCDVFNELFDNVNSNNYHPNELSAELISIYYLQKMDISHYNFENKGLKKLDSWFKKEVFSL
jgi:hypothetical protein